MAALGTLPNLPWAPTLRRAVAEEGMSKWAHQTHKEWLEVRWHAQNPQETFLPVQLHNKGYRDSNGDQDSPLLLARNTWGL
jgi:hypothetical protein